MAVRKFSTILLIIVTTNLIAQNCELGTNSSFAPRWSPDGNHIVFHNNTNSNREIYLYNISKSQLLRLTTTRDHERVPVIASNGKSILFFRTDKDKRYSAIFTLDLANGTERALTALRGKNLDPDWSPDMRQLVFISSIDGNWELHKMQPNDSTSIHRLTYSESYEHSPHWSPDGQYIGYISQQSGQDDIWIMTADGSDQRNVTPDKNEEISYSWSPDGTKLLYSSRLPKSHFQHLPKEERGNASNNSSEIYLIDLSTKRTERLTDNKYLDVYPSWSPDGSKIVYCSCKSGNLQLYLMNIDGGDKTLLVDDVINRQ